MTVVPSQTVDGLPGYLATLRLIQISSSGSFKEAWSRLDLFTASAAEDFLRPKLLQALERKDPDARLAAVMEIALGFGAMAVNAEREELDYLKEVGRRAAGHRTVAESEAEIEEEAIHPPGDISW